MKYLSYEMWAGDGLDDTEGAAGFWEALHHDRLAKYYGTALLSIADRLDKETHDYFLVGGPYDWTLEKLEITKSFYQQKEVMHIKIGMTTGKEEYGIANHELWFENASKFEVRAVKNYKSRRGIDDWLWSEILPIDDNNLSFEVVFASGTSFYIVFPNKRLKVKKVREYWNPDYVEELKKAGRWPAEF